MTPQAYVFSDDPASTNGHHGELVDHLAAMLDPFTTRRLEPLVGATARCLEVGAGAGTIARWMAERAAEVVATDTDPQHIPQHPRLAVWRHDIATDPLEPARFDVIHTRLLLAHLPARRQVVAKLVAALAPGGTLVIDEFSASWDRSVMDSPDPEATRLFTAYHQALMAVLQEAGTDANWGRQVHATMRSAGLVDVESELWSRSWHGGQAGCLLPYAAAAQLREKLIGAGMSGEDIDAFRALLMDPRLVVAGNTAVSTTGRKPATS